MGRLTPTACPGVASDCPAVAPSTQPNIPGRGITASYGVRFWLLVVLIGAGTGLAGAGLIELRRAIQHLAWNYSSGSSLPAAERASDTRRVAVLAIGGVVAGAGGLGLARLRTADVSEALWLRGARLHRPEADRHFAELAATGAGHSAPD